MLCSTPRSRTIGGNQTARLSASTAASTFAARASALAALGPPRYQSGIRSFSWSCRFVAISPGYTVVSETPVPLSSWRSASANIRCAAFVPPYTAAHGNDRSAAPEETTTTWPFARSSRCGRPKWTVRSVPCQLTSLIRSWSSSDWWRYGP